MYELLRSLILFAGEFHWTSRLDLHRGGLYFGLCASTQRWVERYAVKRHHLTGKPGSAFPYSPWWLTPATWMWSYYGGEGWNGRAVVVEGSAVNYREEKPCSCADRPPGIHGRLVGETCALCPATCSGMLKKTSRLVSVLPPRTGDPPAAAQLLNGTQCFSSSAGPTKSHDILAWLSR